MKLPAILLMLLFASTLKSQDKSETDRLTPREFTIPTSPLFDLMGVAPSQVARTADIKDFKVDWSFKNWRINPNLAIQAQPVWELFYNRKSLQRYQQASRFQRTLASLDLSVGTIQTETGDRRLGGAVKINLYKKKDPLLLKDTYTGIEKTFDDEIAQLKEKEKIILQELNLILRPDSLQKKRDELRENDILLRTVHSRRYAAIQEKAAEFIKNNWNAPFIDLAFGKIYTYTTDSAGSFGKLRLNRNTGNGAWLNFGTGIGKRGLISALIRTSFYEEELTFNIKDNVTGNEITDTAIAANKLITLGINFRYGGPIYNFFVEFVREGKTTRTPTDALSSSFNVPDGKSIISSSVKWDVVHPYALNFGGDWRISRNVILNYGMRLVLDENFKTTSFIPIANIACMMR